MKKYFIYLNSIVAKSTFAAAISTVTLSKTMYMLSGAGMIVQSLIDQGVLHTVRGINHVLVRHEQCAVHMADGPRYRRGSGGAG